MRDPARPDPDALLEQIAGDDASRSRGRLKVFFGATAGVGKTYAMVSEARERLREGTDVLIGIVETHGRRETEALLEGLPVLPRRAVDHRGVSLTEFDLDGALSRRPKVILVDELAHTNAPGSRHAKRWQDVEELLAAGIDVYTTVNVQHLESLSDLVARITHVVVRETVPDAVLEQADEIELIDLPPDELLQRLREGKVYLPQQAQKAAQGFFRKGNLIALRQMALRKAAERVDAQMRVYRRALGVAETWPVHERILVGVGASPRSSQVVRSAKRVADRLGADWIAAFVETPEFSSLSDLERGRVWETLRLAERLGATTVTLSGSRASEAIVDYARAHNISRIVVGKPSRPEWRDRFFGSEIDRLTRGSGDIDVHVVSGEEDDEVAPARRTAPLRRPAPRRAYVWATALIGVAAVLTSLMRPYFEITNLAMVHLLAVVIVAARFGRGPSIYASVLSVAAFDFLAVPPYLTFAVSDSRYGLTFLLMFVVAIVISTLTTRIADQAGAARERERRTASLYAISQSLVRLSETRDLLQVGVRHVVETFAGEAAVFLPDAHGRLAASVRSESGFENDEQDRAVASWVYENRRPAGLGTDTLPAARALYLPLGQASGVVGVLAVKSGEPDRFKDPEQLHLLEAFAALIAVAVEQSRLAEDARRVRQLEEVDRLKSEFVTVASHELRSPLHDLAANLERLRTDPSALDSAEAKVGRLRELVDDLLDLSKLESGRAELNRRPVDSGRLVERVVEAHRGIAAERGIDLLGEVHSDLPPTLAAPDEIGRVLDTLVSNALQFTDPSGRVVVSADQVGDVIQFAVADDGHEIPLEEQARIFDRFVPLARGDGQVGTGLGLAIARGIVRAHGGEIWVDSGPGPGCVFSFTLPIAAQETAS